MYLVFSLFTGLLIALMVQVNGLLQGAVGVLPALLMIHGVGLVSSLLFLCGKKAFRKTEPAGKQPEHPAPGHGRFPSWGIITGVLGVGVVFLNNEVFLRGGVLLALSGTLAGQTLAASILELLSFFKERSAPVLQRVLSPVLIIPGTVLIAVKSGISLGWGLLAALPGIILMVQGAMNSKLSVRLDTPKMLILNYGSATAALALLILVTGSVTSAFVRPGWGDVPAYLFFGGGIFGMIVIAVSSFLFTRTSLLRVVLGLYIGQIGLGLVLDLLAGRGIVIEKIIGIVLLICGLLSGKFSKQNT
jgi:bacterial/archaeal transporter family-2 protein